MQRGWYWLLLLLGASGVQAQEAQPLAVSEWKAGVAAAKITPTQPLPMAGYAGRKEPAEGTEQELFAKAIALEDQTGQQLVIVTLDLIGVSTELRDAVLEKVRAKQPLADAALLMNASHTHCGPAYNHPEAEAYYTTLKQTLADVVLQALATLQPAQVKYSVARASVSMNRRTPTETGYRNHPNPAGPVDHSVPVLSIRNPDGTLRAVLFGYACHNTTMGFRRWLGDYAGYAQEYFEQDHPGVTACFLMGCGGDQNPYPRSELKYAQRHGRTLATAVEAAIEVNQSTPLHQQDVHGPLRLAYETVDLSFTEADRADFPYPVHVIRFGDDLLLTALGSEVVIDYALRLKLELTQPQGPAVWVAGYSNVYSGYIPSRRVLVEGGYEASSRPWDPSLEERIVAKVHALVTATTPQAEPAVTNSGN
jgi:hypothetical protein